jgi:hypothetical protein
VNAPTTSSRRTGDRPQRPPTTILTELGLPGEEMDALVAAKVARQLED